MASTSDGVKVKKKIRKSGMKQPPLIKQLKGILSEYPDGGQILKELIQNAEDAGAREVKFLFDSRRINEDTFEDGGREPPPFYNKFFKGPALCVYNDAVFTDKDWEGIQMIYSSVKEEDPMKVGRFGLGFKSVFHITDFPCIISGDTVLLIDPQQPTHDVNSMLDLCALEEYKDDGLDSDAFWRALENTFNLSRNALDENGFHGTLLWFPLREKVSELSETLYNESKVQDLFDAFQSEASNILLFLKNVERMSLNLRKMDTKTTEIVRVEIGDKNGELRAKRDAFKELISKSKLEDEDVVSSINAVIHTESADTKSSQEWLIVNYFVRNSASVGFSDLICNTSLGYSPYVGVAAPVNRNSDGFEGHLFCFLPLPNEGERLTGLPVHVNGFFALSQNRHHMKWETEEQEGKQIDDKSILWNKALIEEALPKAYKLIIQGGVRLFSTNSGEDRAVRYVYNMMPLCDKTPRKIHKKWATLVNKLYETLEMSSIVYAPLTCEWISVQKACFATLSQREVKEKRAVIRCLDLIGHKYVDIPAPLFQTIQAFFPNVEDLTPRAFARYMQSKDDYRQLSCEDKMHVLTYLLSDNGDIDHISGLHLLPLASGKFEVFNKRSNAVYICSDAAAKMFPGLENRLIAGSGQLGIELTEQVERISKAGIFQIQKLSVDCAKQLLKETIDLHFGSSTNLQLTMESNLTINWLRDVWDVLIDKNIVGDFKDMSIIPVLSRGRWPEPEGIELVKLTESVMLKKSGNHTLSDGMCACLRSMYVRILPELPEWLQFESIESFVYQPTTEGIMSLLCDVFDKFGDSAISSFNIASEKNNQMAEAMLEFIATLSYIKDGARKLLKKLRLFKAAKMMNDNGDYSSIYDTPIYVLENIDFPNGVEFPLKCLTVHPSKEVLLRQLGGEIVSGDTMVLETLKKIQLSAKTDEMILMLSFVVKRPHLVANNLSICENASQIPFLEAGNAWRKPSDLFDPSNLSLQHLLFGEPLFPDIKYQENDILVLKKLGLKGEDEVDASVLLKVARSLNSLSSESRQPPEVLKKASEFMNILSRRPQLLDDICYQSGSLRNAIVNLACIPVHMKEPFDYPNGLPWFSRTFHLCKPSEAKMLEFSLLAGAIMPMVECESNTIAQKFEWNLAPGIDKVLKQLSLIRTHYNISSKPDFTRAIQKIYKYMNTCKQEVSDIMKGLEKEELLWTGSSFEIPEKVITSHRSQDLDLSPYYFHLPEEFSDMEDLFMCLGCHREQTSNVLLSVLKCIQNKYESSESSTHISRNREIILEVLNAIASRKRAGTLDIKESELLILTEQESSEKLNIQLVSNCIFADDEDELDLDEEESYFIVNSSVPVSVAKDLGVKTINKKTILGATEELDVEEWGQTESLTTRISTLLKDGYKDGLSVPKELVQNADDAGATIVKFLYDERQNDDARRKEKLLSVALEECQGPALWVYNNSLFSNEDLVNITKLNGATKANVQDKIGKFGLGFCSVYNVTDVPSFISGSNMVIFDPHETYLEDARQTRGKGLKINLFKHRVIRRNIDQFKPFDGVFGCDLSGTKFEAYKGTLLRLPLRTDHQAKKSKISEDAYTKDEVTALFRQLIENAGNIILFTQNVEIMEIYHLSKTEDDPSRAKLIFRIKKGSDQLSRGSGESNTQGVLTRVPHILRKGEEFAEIHNVKVCEEVLCGRFTERKETKKEAYPLRTESRWIISWALGTNQSLQLAKTDFEKGAVPLSSVAVPIKEHNGTPVPIEESPCGFYTKGHLFCFLPLPIKTALSFHINGSFSVTSDRRGLVFFTEDDKRRSNNCMWNQALMEDSVVHGFIQLLLFLSRSCCDEYNYSSLWPLEGTKEIKHFKNSFYKALLIDKPKLFRGVQEWLSVEEIVFLDPVVRSNTIIGETAFSLLSCFPVRAGKKIIEISPKVLKTLCNFKSDFPVAGAVISEEEFIMHFLSTIDSPFWMSKLDKRNELVLYALKCQSKMVIAKLRGIRCIPSEPDNILRQPSELICPETEIADMFDITDGKFPLKAAGFCETSVISKLIAIGMNDIYLPNNMLIDRCKSVEEMTNLCGSCAVERCVRLLKYCGKPEVLHNLAKENETVLNVRNNLLLPVLPCPKYWNFLWKAETEEMITTRCQKHTHTSQRSIRFKGSVDLYRETLYNCSGSVCSFIDETHLKSKCHLPEGLFNMLGINSETSIKSLSEQIIVLSEQYKDPDRQFSSLDQIYRATVDRLARLTNDKAEDDIARLPWFLSMKEQPVVLIGRHLVMPCKVAFDVNEECPPELHRLREVEYKRKRVYKGLGVTEFFSVTYLVSILKTLRAKWFQRKCEDIDLVASVLRNLCESMSKENITYESIKDNADNVVAPDVGGFLMPTYELVIEDPAYTSSATLHILHGKLSPDTGRTLGVKSKQRKIVELFSTSFFMPFGQNESLVTRLTGILEDYPCDSSIMKELIQNADDAGATEICFIKDYMSHSSEKMFGRKEMQGPSLCVFNDSYFTDRDFDGFRQLGVGSKREDPSKTGQYGIGFNAVYHLTDVPSFLTVGPGLGNQGQMCIFDPLMTYLEGPITKENPGIKCDVEFVRESFPDMLLGYPTIPNILESRQGTIFRLPLRQHKSEISNNVVSVERLDELLEEFKTSMFESLLFLKSVECIKVLKNTSEGLVEDFIVQTKLLPEDALSRNKYHSEVKEAVRVNNDDRKGIFCMSPIEYSYKLDIVDNKCRHERWLIMNRFGYEHTQEIDEHVLSAVQEKVIGLLPIASVAIPWPENNWVEKGEHKDKKTNVTSKKAFCFLPLPIESGLPVHVNGHFALDKPRTKLLDDGIRKCWNQFVVEELLSRAWISAMQYMKKQIVENCLRKNEKKNKARAQVLEMYHGVFPRWNTASDKFWKILVSSFYRIVVRDRVDIFPSIHTETDSSTGGIEHSKLHLEWVPLSRSEHDFDGMFNVIRDIVYSSHCAFTVDDRWLLEKTLKTMGMKIIETPQVIGRSIKQSGVSFVPTCSQEMVINFLNTFECSKESSCKLGGINIRLSETTIKDTTALKCILKYIVDDKSFIEKVEGLPLCLTNDGLLHAFKRNAELYNSNMCKLLTGSANSFIHNDLVIWLDRPELYDLGVIKRFEVNELASIFAETFDPAILASGNHVLWDKQNGIPLKPDALFRIFDFIYSKSLDAPSTYTSSQNVNHSQFQSNVRKLIKWSLIPCTWKYGSQTRHELVSVSETSHLFHKSFRNDTVGEIIRRLNIAVLDTSPFREVGKHLIYPLQKMLPSTDVPVKLLECLFYYKTRIESSELSCDESMSLLGYFDDNIDKLRGQANENHFKYMLKCLPLYISYQGTVMVIDRFRDVVMLPTGMPVAGLESWAQQTGILFLQDTDRLRKLYKFLGLSSLKHIDIYVDKILPNIQFLPRSTWKEHIIFIRDRLLLTSYNQELDTKQCRLVEKIKHIAFIRVKGNFKKACELFDDSNPVFIHMLTEDNFPTEDYRDYAWVTFIRKLGMITEATDEMLLDFARQLEAKSNSPISSQTRVQSSAVVDCLFDGMRQDRWSAEVLERIRCIRFVAPHKVNLDMTDTSRQPGDGDILICLSGATSSKNEDYCWSTLNLLSHIPETDEMLQSLGILRFPPVSKIVQHCQNIADVFNIQLRDGLGRPIFIRQLMEKLYKVILQNFCPEMKQNFQVTPIVFHPDDNKMLQIRQVVTNLSDDEDIKPYLYKLPNCFGPYFELFTKLGSHENPLCSDYTMVLEDIKQQFGNESVPANILLCVKKALGNIVRLISKETNPLHNVGKFYIPDRKQVLRCSRSLTVSNNFDIEERLDGNLDLDFFLGFKELEIENVSDPAIPFFNCPPNLKPNILTDVVTEQILVENVDQQECVKAQRLEHQLKSPQFIEGIIRLVKHQLRHSQHAFNENYERPLLSSLTNLSVTKVSGLKTILFHKDQRVNGTERDTTCFIRSQVHHDYSGEESTAYELYFQLDTDDDLLIYLIEDPQGLVKLIDLCSGGILEKEQAQHLPLVLRLLEQPNEIKQKLDRLRIDAYELPSSFFVSVFPKPGTYVEEKFHPFLEQSILPFKTHEYMYVAYEIEDADDANDPVYIYAHIIGENRRGHEDSVIDITYNVDVGVRNDESVNVRISRLYRFRPRQIVEENAVVLYDIEPVVSIPIDENFRRVRNMLIEAWKLDEGERKRVIRRLLTRWHPDRNKDYREYAQRLFNYVNEVVIRLESNEEVTDAVTNETGRMPPDMSRSSFGSSNQAVYSRGCRYATAFHDNMRDYNRSTRTGNYLHFRAEEAAVRHVGEAKRWYRQAVHDFKAANSTLSNAEDDSSFNWVCYKCHQASEKALKAAWFSKNANRTTRKDHYLKAIASGLDDGSFFNEASCLESIIGDYWSMRYPDAVVDHHQIPSEMFDSTKAEKVLEITKRILDMASEFIG